LPPTPESGNKEKNLEAQFCIEIAFPIHPGGKKDGNNSDGPTQYVSFCVEPDGNHAGKSRKKFYEAIRYFHHILPNFEANMGMDFHKATADVK
jgi:hypothetical protein